MTLFFREMEHCTGSPMCQCSQCRLTDENQVQEVVKEDTLKTAFARIQTLQDVAIHQEQAIVDLVERLRSLCIIVNSVVSTLEEQE